MIDIYKKIDGQIEKVDNPEQDCWINIYPPFNHKNLEDICSKLDVPIDFLQDSLDIDERSRFEVEDDVKLIVLNTPIINESELEEGNEAIYITIPVAIILPKNMILTISSFENPVIESFLNKRVKNFDPTNRSHFILQIFDRSVYYFLHYLKQINNRRHIIEEELITSSRNKELTQLLTIQKSLVYFVTTLKSNELVMMKIHRIDFLGIKENEDLSDLLEDAIIDNSQALEMSNVYTNILNGTMDAFASLISNNLNMVMRRLTSVTIVLMVPTLVASFYGMNVDLPMQDKPLAFMFTLMLSASLSFLLIWIFMRKHWF